MNTARLWDAENRRAAGLGMERSSHAFPTRWPRWICYPALRALCGKIVGKGESVTHGRTAMLGQDRSSGGGGIRTLNGKGQNIVRVGATTLGDGMVYVLNAKGQYIVQLGALNDGTGGVSTYDPSGIRQAGLLAPQ